MKILKNISTLTLAAMLLLQSGAQAQNVSAQSGIKARGRGRNLILTSQGKTHRLDLGDNIDAAKLDDVRLLFATRRPDFTYLLIAACGSSKLKPDARQCGAGTECNLLWLKLTTDWHISDLKSVRYESCWSPISSENGYKISGNILELEYYDLRRKVNSKLTYDATRPESGFLVEESPIKDAEPN